MSFLRLLFIVGIFIFIPFLSSIIFGDPLYATYSLVIATFILEYMAYPIGPILGIKPVTSAVITLATTLGYFFLFYEIIKKTKDVKRLKNWFIRIDESKWIRRLRKSQLLSIPLIALTMGVLPVAFIAWLINLDIRKTAILIVLAEITGLMIMLASMPLIFNLLSFL
jgi:hypothetical protein